MIRGYIIMIKGLSLVVFLLFLQICLPHTSYASDKDDNNKVGVAVLMTSESLEHVHKNFFYARVLYYDVLPRFDNIRIEHLDHARIIAADSLDLMYQEIEDPIARKKEIIKYVKKVVERKLIDMDVRKVIMPGNFYNLQREVYSVTPNRSWVAIALRLLALEGKIHLFGICGGMQEILDDIGIEIPFLTEVMDEYDAKYHSSSVGEHEYHVRSMSVRGNTKFERFAEKCHIVNDEYGVKTVGIMELHTCGALDNDANRIKLWKNGYKIGLMGLGGVIEGLEDKKGNLFTEGHPEVMISSLSEKSNRSDFEDKSLCFAQEILHEFIERKFND